MPFLNLFSNGSSKKFGFRSVKPYVGIAATGGTTQTYVLDGFTYRSHTFTSTGTFSVSSLGDSNGNVDYLLVAGGGGNGCGGAGGMRELSTTVSATNYSITVGAGTSGNGGNSSAFGQSSTGGGQGYVFYASGNSGGCGGGAGGANHGQVYGSGGAGNAGGYNPVEGYAGGSSGWDNLGGGGGAGGAGGSDGSGGAARNSSLKTGSAIAYSKGGEYGGDTTAGTGNGGVYWSGGVGASGTVIIRYRIA